MAKAIWDKKNPKSKHKQLTSAQQAQAKKSAKRHGRSSPSLVDNINASKKSSKKKSSSKTKSKSKQKKS